MGIIALGEEFLHILSWLFICMEALDTKFEFLQLPQPCFSAGWLSVQNRVSAAVSFQNLV